jgi:YVTN family beta-propeller protein
MTKNSNKKLRRQESKRKTREVIDTLEGKKPQKPGWRLRSRSFIPLSRTLLPIPSQVVRLNRLQPSLEEANVKSRTKQSLMKRVNSQSSFPGTSYQLLHRTISQHLSIVLFLLLSMGIGLGTATAQAQTRAYVTNENSNTVSVIDIATNTVVATIPVGEVPIGVAITPAPQVPTSKEQCKHGGWKKFGPPAGPFKNQGQCVSYVEHH